MNWDEIEDALKSHNEFLRKVLDFPPGARAVICNGRVLGPLDNDEKFTYDDFSLLERFSMSAHVDKIHSALKSKTEGEKLHVKKIVASIS